MRAVFGKSLHIVQVKETVALGFADGEEIGHGKRDATDAENVGAEVRNLLLDVQVRALHERHHGDQGRDAHGQPEDREGGAELVARIESSARAMLSPMRSMDVRSDTSFARALLYRHASGARPLTRCFQRI